MRFPALVLVSVLALGLSGARAAGLPDTGQDLCYYGTMVACTSANTGDAATYSRQDGRFGRDAKATAGTLVKIGGGAAGFDYTKVANDGSDLAASATLGSAANDWACTRDNITGLTWEVKTATNTDLRYSAYTYTWYSTNAATNGGNAGSTGSNTCNGTLPSNLCNTEAFVAAVNTAALCGYADWRMPTTRELQTLVHAGTQNPSIDTNYFPKNSKEASSFWSGSSFVPNPVIAWYVRFNFGDTDAGAKTSRYSVRLVRGGQF